MKGADKFYNIISKATYKKLGDLRKLNRDDAWYLGKEVYINGNVLYALSDHARGKCFRICLVKDNTLVDKELVSKDNCLEVYGVIGGNLGWTEEYGWLKKGTWVTPILKYLRDLEKAIEKHDEEQNELKRLKEKENNKPIQEKITMFNDMFRQ